MKKAIVTGATGFIGSFFVDYLLKNNIEVLALGRKNINEINKIILKKINRAKYININMQDILDLEKSIEQIGWISGEDCVFINLAWGGVNELSDLNIEYQIRNVYQSVNALEVAKKIGCNRFIQIGTMEEAFTERYLKLDHNKDKEYNRHVIYSVAKIAAKNALMYKSKQIGIDFIYVLHSHVMGAGDEKNSFLQVTLQKIIKGEPLIFSTGEQYFDVISVADCCLGYLLICLNGKPNTQYWVGSGDPRCLREYVERMYSLFPNGKEMQFGKLPYNDIILDKNIFSINNLTIDTGYIPTMTYEDCVRQLHEHLINI